MDSSILFAGVDIGAGSGAKIGIFDQYLVLLAETELAVEQYGLNAGDLVSGVRTCLSGMAEGLGACFADVAAAGVVGPGVYLSDGTIARAVNLSFLDGVNMKQLIEDKLGIPAGCMNDADAGALAEWRYHRTELVYWVLGGGWGGAWVARDGKIRNLPQRWDGNDGSIHPAAEPGYVLGLDKSWLSSVFSGAGISFSDFERLSLLARGEGTNVLLGPDNDPATVRAEAVVSGTGRWLIMRLFADKGGTLAAGLSCEDLEKLGKLSSAPEVLDKIKDRRMPLLKQTDSLFAEVFAEAAFKLLKKLEEDGCPGGAPVFLAGKPARAFFSFGPYMSGRLRAKGMMNGIFLSELQKKDLNPNLAGAGFLAGRAWKHKNNER
ncbi:MAG: ROK family protein [Verrucomicrobiota bacterium]